MVNICWRVLFHRYDSIVIVFSYIHCWRSHHLHYTICCSSFNMFRLLVIKKRFKIWPGTGQPSKPRWISTLQLPGRSCRHRAVLTKKLSGSMLWYRLVAAIFPIVHKWACFTVSVVLRAIAHNNHMEVRFRAALITRPAHHMPGYSFVHNFPSSSLLSRVISSIIALTGSIKSCAVMISFPSLSIIQTPSFLAAPHCGQDLHSGQCYICLCK